MSDPLYREIHEDHEEVKGILKELKKAAEESSPRREEWFEKLRMELKPHMKAEETAFYPALTRQKESRQDALEAIEEHHISEVLLNELESMTQDEEVWAAKVSVLQELIEHHVEEEEGTLFEDARKTLSDSETEQILEKFQKEKERFRSTLS